MTAIQSSTRLPHETVRCRSVHADAPQARSETPDLLEHVLEDVRAGRPIVLVDDEDRENEGDLVVAAERVTSETVNFMVRHGCGLLGLALSPAQCERLGLEPVAGHNVESSATPWTPHIDARDGITTGTSAQDRARTIRIAIDERTTRADIVVGKGHVPCLRAREGGVLARPGHTEGSTDLARMAGLREGAVICEIMNPNGTMARAADLREFCRRHGLRMLSIQSLIERRRKHEPLVRREVAVKLPTPYGTFDLIAYRANGQQEVQLALCMGGIGMPGWSTVNEGGPVLVRLHSECLTGDCLGSELCDCGDQLRESMSRIAEHGRGVVLYCRQEGRGIGLLAKLRAYHLQQSEGLDTVESNTRLGFAPDERDYHVAAQILLDLGVRTVRLLTNNPGKVDGLEGRGVHVIERVPIRTAPTDHSRSYLRTKQRKLGHLLDIESDFPRTAPQAVSPSSFPLARRHPDERPASSAPRGDSRLTSTLETAQ